MFPDKAKAFLTQAFRVQKHLEVFKQMGVKHSFDNKTLQQDTVTKNWGTMAALQHIQCALKHIILAKQDKSADTDRP